MDNLSRLKQLDSKMDTLTGTIYGKYYFDIPLFIGAQYAYSTTKLKSGDSIVALLASGSNKYHNILVDVGYNHSISPEVLLTPTVGLKYVAHNWKLGENMIKSYKVETKNGSATYATADLKLQGMFNLQSYNLMPYISAGFESRISQKRSKIIITKVSNRQSNTFGVEVATKSQFNTGTGINAKFNEMFSASLGYNYVHTKQYKSHGGTVGLRLDF